MDGDPAVEPELDGFSRVLPLPYRVALIIVLGISAWALSMEVPLLIHSRRYLGMGTQPALSLHHSHRRTLSHPLPFTLLSAPTTAPPLLLPHRDFSLHPARALAAPILDPYTRQPKRHCGLGNPAKPIPSSTGSRFCSAAAIC
jgi:hypothetical protein